MSAIGGQENPDSDASNTVTDIVVRDVIVFPIVVVVVIVWKGEQENCLGPNGSFAPTDVGLLLLVVLGGIYDSEQSVSSSSVAFALLVTVKGTQVKSGASSDSEVSVIVAVVVVKVVESVDVVAVSVAAGQAEQYPSEPQYAIDLQHCSVQQLSSLGHDPSSQHCSEVGL